jgi:hypothetical protein
VLSLSEFKRSAEAAEAASLSVFRQLQFFNRIPVKQTAAAVLAGFQEDLK